MSAVPLTGAGQRFGLDARLKKRADIRRIYDEGRRVGGRHFLGFFRDSSSGDIPPRLGITVTRRVGNAVARNRLRRVIREFFRLRRRELRTGFEVVINARDSAPGQTTRALWQDLEAVFLRAGLFVARVAPPKQGRQASSVRQAP